MTCRKYVHFVDIEPIGHGSRVLGQFLVSGSWVTAYDPLSGLS